MNYPHKNGLILSGQYVGDELEAEFGRIPPAFLPVGHECLYIEQIRQFRRWGVQNIYLSIPDDFNCTAYHLDKLRELDIHLIVMSNQLSLGEAVARALDSINECENILIMHGDTLFSGNIPDSEDFVAVDVKPPHYRWGNPHLTSVGNVQLVLTGLFSLSNKNEFLSALVKTGYDFIKAIHFMLERGFAHKNIEGWLDFGHLQTYFHSKNFIKINRSFNNITFYKHKIIKSSVNKKIISEALWYEKIPYYLRLYTGTYLGRSGDSGYELANEVLPTLHDLYIFSRLDNETWGCIVKALSDFLELCYSDQYNEIAKDDKSEKNYLNFLFDKTIVRIKVWAQKECIDMSHGWIVNGNSLPSLDGIINSLKKEVDLNAMDIKHGIMHGDLCFTNIFYDSRTQLIKAIDPRGYVFDGIDSVFGFLQYDLAKINHSLSGYDDILAGRYLYKLVDNYCIDFTLNLDQYRENIKNAFTKINIHGVKIDSPCVKIITILLFISMVPLHDDSKERQDAFIANALLLYAEYVRKNDNNSNGR